MHTNVWVLCIVCSYGILFHIANILPDFLLRFRLIPTNGGWERVNARATSQHTRAQVQRVHTIQKRGAAACRTECASIIFICKTRNAQSKRVCGVRAAGLHAKIARHRSPGRWGFNFPKIMAQWKINNSAQAQTTKQAHQPNANHSHADEFAFVPPKCVRVRAHVVLKSDFSA